MSNTFPGLRQPVLWLTKLRRPVGIVTAVLLLCWSMPQGVQAAAGDLDSTFGTGGKVATDFGAPLLSGASISDIALQSDGKIVVAGTAGVGVNSHFGLVRYQNSSPTILSASVSGKRLIVIGENFDNGAVILLNGKKQKTANDEQNPTTTLIGKKAGKKIARGETVTLQIRNSDGTLSQEFRFTRPNQ